VVLTICQLAPKTVVRVRTSWRFAFDLALWTLSPGYDIVNVKTWQSIRS